MSLIGVLMCLIGLLDVSAVFASVKWCLIVQCLMSLIAFDVSLMCLMR